MSNPDKGAEDSPGWGSYLSESNGSSVETCANCGITIKLWHCADAGCPWCAKCGANAKDIREKRKNGTD